MTTIQIIHGDCFDKLRDIPDGSVGAIVSDPPYGLEFQGEDCDAPWKESDTNGFRRADNPKDVGRDNVFGRTSRTSPEYKTGHTKNWQAGGSFSKPGIGERKIAWPSFSSTSRFGAVNPTCAVCGGRLRGAKKCSCEQPHDHWKDIGKRRKLPEDTPSEITGGGMQDQMKRIQEWHQGWLTEVFRILRPGGIAKVFAATRTQHRLSNAMESVEFDICGIEAWGYFTGFPKSLDVSKAIDKMQGVDPDTEIQIQQYLKECREGLGLTKSEVDKTVFGGTTSYSWVEGGRDQTYLPTPEEWSRLKVVLHLDDRYDDYIQLAIPSREMRSRSDGGKGIIVAEVEGDFGYQLDGERWNGLRRITASSSDEAKQFDGYGTALKPAWEPFVIGRKPE